MSLLALLGIVAIGLGIFFLATHTLVLGLVLIGAGLVIILVGKGNLQL